MFVLLLERVKKVKYAEIATPSKQPHQAAKM
jgi:hypothetical protein